MRDHLGHWINNRLRKGVQGQGETAREELSAIGIPEQELGVQWESQKAAQLSVRARECQPTHNYSLLQLVRANKFIYQMHPLVYAKKSMPFSPYKRR